jgi:hypothetical protein
VTDRETGLPLAGVLVAPFGNVGFPDDGRPDTATTAADGTYRITQIKIATVDNARLEQVPWRAEGAEHYPTIGRVDLVAGQTATLDLTMLPLKYVRLIGTVRDVTTHAPIADATVASQPLFLVKTDVDGNYDTGLIQLGLDEPPPDLSAHFFLNTSAPGYFFKGGLEVVVHAD